MKIFLGFEQEDFDSSKVDVLIVQKNADQEVFTIKKGDDTNDLPEGDISGSVLQGILLRLIAQATKLEIEDVKDKYSILILS